jgi:hypothetical protein
VHAAHLQAPGVAVGELAWLTELHRAAGLHLAALEQAVAILHGARLEEASHSAALKVECCILEWLTAAASTAHAAFLRREAWMAALIAERSGGGGGASARGRVHVTLPLVTREELPREGEVVPQAVRMRWAAPSSRRPSRDEARRGGGDGGGGGDAEAAAFLADALFA